MEINGLGHPVKASAHRVVEAGPDRFGVIDLRYRENDFITVVGIVHRIFSIDRDEALSRLSWSRREARCP